MKNVSYFKIHSYFTSFILYSIVLFTGARVSAQFDLIYENHNQAESRIIRAVADNGAGNTAVAGHFEWTLTLGSFTLTNPSEIWDGFVGKFDSNTDTWLWAKKITLVSGGSTSDIMDLAMDNTGNVYITGTYAGVVSFDNISLSSTKNGNQYTLDIFVAKYNSGGGIVWAKSFGSKAGLDMAKTIALDGSNNIFIGGMFTNKAIKCGAPTNTADKYDVYLAKLNNAGTALWEKRYTSTLFTCNSPNNSGENLTTDVSGNVFLTGEFSGTMSFGSGSGLTISSNNGSADVFTAKINGSGTTQWVKATGGGYNDFGNAILPDASGNVYVGGAIVNATGFSDAFLSKYSPTGNIVWSVNPYPTSPSFASNSIKRIIPASNAILVSDARVGFKTISLLDGSVISSDSLEGNGFTYPPATGYVSVMDLAPAGTGYVFSAIGQCGTVTIGSTPLVSTNNCPYSGGWRDLFIVRTSSPPLAAPPGGTIVNQNSLSYEFLENQLEFYPNPASDQLHINLPVSEKEITLFIQNQFGQTVWSEKFESQSRTATINLDENNFHNGIYYMVCLSNGDVKTRRLIIEK